MRANAAMENIIGDLSSRDLERMKTRCLTAEGPVLKS
jgi:hypothetical protein